MNHLIILKLIKRSPGWICFFMAFNLLAFQELIIDNKIGETLEIKQIPPVTNPNSKEQADVALVPDINPVVPDVPVENFATYLMNPKENKLHSQKIVNESSFYCTDKPYVSSYDHKVLFQRYLHFFLEADKATFGNNGNAIFCTVYYREKFARTLFTPSTQNGHRPVTAVELEKYYYETMNQLAGELPKNSNSDLFIMSDHSEISLKLKAIHDLVSIIQQYWLTRFINYVYLNKKQDLAIKGVGGTALAFGTLATIAYFSNNKKSILWQWFPRIASQLFKMAQTTAGQISVGSGLGAAFAAASHAPDSQNEVVWKSPLELLNFPEDKATIDTEDMGKNLLSKMAIGVGGSVVGGYLSWNILEKSSQNLWASLGEKSLLKKSILWITNKSKPFFSNKFILPAAEIFKKYRMTQSLGSMFITEALFEWAQDYIRDTTTEDLEENFENKLQEFLATLKEFKSNTADTEIGKRGFAQALEMYDSLRLLVAHRLIPAYERVLDFEGKYNETMSKHLVCDMANFKVFKSSDSKLPAEVEFLDTFRIKEGKNFIESARAFKKFENAINSSEIPFFSKFFHQKLALLKISFFFDEKFGLDINKITDQSNLDQFGEGYLRVFRGELAYNLQPLGELFKKDVVQLRKYEASNLKSNEEELKILINNKFGWLYEDCLKFENKPE